MASKEPFLPLATEEDPENPMGRHAVPTAAQYDMNPPSVSNATYNPSYRSDNNPQPMSFESSGENFSQDNMMLASNHHTQCFNSCCDFRRAVLIVNGISIGIKLMAMIGIALVVHYANENLDDIENDMNDDVARKQVDEMFKSGQVAGFEWLLEIIEAIAIAIHLCGIYGALKYKQWGIIAAGSIFALQVLTTLFSLDIAGLIVGLLMLYPHVCMWKLMKEGIMTPQNYHKVASCCGDKHM